MKAIKKRLALWHIVLIVGTAAIAIPVAAHVNSSVTPAVNDGPKSVEMPHGANDHYAAVKISTNIKAPNIRKHAFVDPRLMPRQDYYDRRRQYWEERVDRRMEYEDEYMDEESGDREKADSKEDKASNDDKDDSAEKEDKERDYYEQRRNYWREQLDEDW